jgi:hypothetical protein
MQRSFAWGMIAILAIMLAPFAGVLAVPASAVYADAASPNAAPPDDEVIVITSAGQLRVDDPYTPTGYKPVSWNSGSEVGWTVVAGGDFNGDGDAELVAARGSIVKVFDPVVQAGKAPVAFTVDLGSQRNARLLNTGDFDADGKDEFAVVNYVPGGGSIQAALQIFDGGANATASEWTQRNYAEYAIMFQDMGVGDFNTDGADDLVLVRNPSQQSKLLMTWNVRNWTSIAQQGYDFGWLAVGGGNISSSNPGDEIAVTRSGVLATYVSAIIFRVSGTSYVDMVPNSGYKFYPYFTSLATGDLNGDSDDEVVLLRDPGSASGTSLTALNPFGTTMRDFQVGGIGGGASAWRLVRTGDIDGDGRDEAVIIRSDRYRIYTEPQVDNRFIDTTGTFYVSSSNTNLPFMTLANVDGAGQPLGPTLSVTPASLSFSLDCGNTSPVKPLSITNSGTESSFAWQAQAIEDNGSGWLLIDTTSGTTPGTVNVSVRPGVAKGTYTGKIRITATDTTVQNRTVDVPITYAAVCAGFAVSPTTLNFNLAWGSTASQSVVVSSAGPTAWTTTVAPVSPTTSCDWLILSAASGTTPGSVNVSANSVTAGVGSKRCSIIFSALDTSVPGSPQYVTVNLTVPDPGFAVSPTEITIWQKIGAAAVTREVQIIRPLKPTTWTATAQPLSVAAGLAEKLANGQATITAEGLIIDGVPAEAPVWLAFTPVAGTTPTTMALSVKPGTPAGTYRAVINVVAYGDPNLTNPIQSVTVTAYVADFKFSFLPLVRQ